MPQGKPKYPLLPLPPNFFFGGGIYTYSEGTAATLHA